LSMQASEATSTTWLIAFRRPEAKSMALGSKLARHQIVSLHALLIWALAPIRSLSAVPAVVLVDSSIPSKRRVVAPSAPHF